MHSTFDLISSNSVTERSYPSQSYIKSRPPLWDPNDIRALIKGSHQQLGSWRVWIHAFPSDSFILVSYPPFIIAFQSFHLKSSFSTFFVDNGECTALCRSRKDSEGNIEGVCTKHISQRLSLLDGILQSPPAW